MTQHKSRTPLSMAQGLVSGHFCRTPRGSLALAPPLAVSACCCSPQVRLVLASGHSTPPPPPPLLLTAWAGVGVSSVCAPLPQSAAERNPGAWPAWCLPSHTLPADGVLPSQGSGWEAGDRPPLCTPRRWRSLPGLSGGQSAGPEQGRPCSAIQPPS